MSGASESRQLLCSWSREASVISGKPPDNVSLAQLHARIVLIGQGLDEEGDAIPLADPCKKIENTTLTMQIAGMIVNLP